MRKPISEVKKVARLIRNALARKFPGTKFRVIPHDFPGAHINIYWPKGPTYEMVKEITHTFEIRVKYIAHARSYENGIDPNSHVEFITQAGKDLAALKNLPYNGRWSDAEAQRILSGMDLTDGYKGISEADLF
jgi:hypothetical protein